MPGARARSLDAIAWTRYRIPFAHEFSTGHGSVDVREGLLLRVTAGDVEGFGEAAAVPGFGHPAADQLEAEMAAQAEALFGNRYQAEECSPPVRAAVDIALWDLQARQADLPLARLIAPIRRDPIAVNALVSTADTAAASAAARQAVDAGFRCVKLKVGMASSPRDELERATAVRQAIGPETALRVDANGAWGLDQASETLALLKALKVELVEQPVPAPDLAGMAALRKMAMVPVAADESVGTPKQARQVIAAGAADIMVLKPMAAGGLTPCLEIADLAQQANLRVLATTSVDTVVGIAAALHLAALLQDAELACGLATAGLIESDLSDSPLNIAGGWAGLPTGPGLGCSLDDEKLARYGDGWRELRA